MQTKQVGISLDAVGQGCVTVDGNDVSGVCRGVFLAAEVDEPTYVTLDLQPRRVLIEVQGVVTIDDKTAKLLVALGWKAPPEQDYQLEPAADEA